MMTYAYDFEMMQNSCYTGGTVRAKPPKGHFCPKVHLAQFYNPDFWPDFGNFFYRNGPIFTV